MEILLYWILIILSVLISVSFLILLERKLLSSIQLRKSPNISLMNGLFHSFSDAKKLFLKNYMYPDKSNNMLFMFSPILLLLISLSMWLYFPFGSGVYYIETSIIFLMVLMSLSVFPFIFCGWTSNSKYSMLGSVRTIAQILSYEVSLLLIILSISQCTESLFMLDYVIFQFNYMNFFFSYFICMLMFINFLAEMNRIPFDFSESESELVSGFNTEIGGILFVMIFLAEYSSILLMSSLLLIMFFSVPFMFIFVMFLSSYIIMLRGSMPRYRYDMLMIFSWKKLLPFSLSLLFFMFMFKYIYK